MTSYSQISGMNASDLSKELKKAQKEALEMRMRIRLGQEKDTSKMTKLRKHVARLRTAETQSAHSSLTPGS